MGDTKEIILNESINLFNQNGCMNTTTRHIAEKLGISVGNLYYHFKNKEEIIIAIYNEYMKKITELTSIDNEVDKPFDYYGFVQQQMQYEFKYRFLRQELNNIYQKYDSVRLAFEKDIEIKKEQIKSLYLHKIKYGYMKVLDENELEFLISNTWIIGTHWELYWIINQSKDEFIRRKKGVLNILYFIKPYLTKKGLEKTNLQSSIKYLNEEINNA